MTLLRKVEEVFGLPPLSKGVQDAKDTLKHLPDQRTLREMRLLVQDLERLARVADMETGIRALELALELTQTGQIPELRKVLKSLQSLLKTVGPEGMELLSGLKDKDGKRHSKGG